MTTLTKPVKRKTSIVFHGRALCIEIRDSAIETITIREAGRRRGYSIPILAAYQLGARLHAEELKKAKALKRKLAKQSKQH